MVTYQNFASDLRTLADLFDTHTSDLPLPRYAEQGLGIDIHVPEARDVFRAAAELGATVRERGNTTTDVAVGTIHLRFVHVSDASQAKWNAQQSYRQNLASA